MDPIDLMEIMVHCSVGVSGGLLLVQLLGTKYFLNRKIYNIAILFSTICLIWANLPDMIFRQELHATNWGNIFFFHYLIDNNFSGFESSYQLILTSFLFFGVMFMSYTVYLRNKIINDGLVKYGLEKSDLC